MIELFGKPNCPACADMKAALSQAGKEYEYIDISTNESARDELMGAGFRSLPQAKVGGEWIQNVNEVLFQ